MFSLCAKAVTEQVSVIQNCKQQVLQIVIVVDNQKSAECSMQPDWDSLSSILGGTKHYQISSSEKV